jgi:ribosomal protein L10
MTDQDYLNELISEITQLRQQLSERESEISVIKNAISKIKFDSLNVPIKEWTTKAVNDVGNIVKANCFEK